MSRYTFGFVLLAVMLLLNSGARPDQTIVEIDGYFTRTWQDAVRLWVALGVAELGFIPQARLFSHRLDGQLERDWFAGSGVRQVGTISVFQDQNAIIVHDRAHAQMLIADLDHVQWQVLTDCRWEMCVAQPLGPYWLVSKYASVGHPYDHDVVDLAENRRYSFQQVGFLTAQQGE